MDVLDQSLLDTATNTAEVKYGGFWPRFGAVIIDGLILIPISFGISYFNITDWKNSFILVVLTLITTAYKPFMEASYGATWGKMAFKLKVVDLEYGQASVGEVIMRNIFDIVPSLFTLFFTILLYNNPEFESINGFLEYSAFSQQFTALQVISYLSILITIIDGIVLIADSRSRALHDKIAGTYVIVRP